MSNLAQDPAAFPPATEVFTANSTARMMHDLAWEGIEFGADRIAAPADAYWATLSAAGTRSWLDTGDIDEAQSLWNSSFSALTTNNSLLNKEVQKGEYDELIHRAGAMLSNLSAEERVIEIAFLLNARHALRLASRIGCRVSVELHTDLAHDVDRSVAYGLRYYALHGEHIIVKIPLTPSGLIATRRLRALGVPVNFTLGFSARQNALATAFAAPTYVNVFLGRLNAYVSDNKLGSGDNIGEKTTLASQRAVRAACRGRLCPTWQIAASMRSGDQVVELAGVDVHTMPTKVAQEAGTKRLAVQDCSDHDPDVVVKVPHTGVECLWVIGKAEKSLTDDLVASPPQSAQAVMDRCAKHGLGGLFPVFTDQEAADLAKGGKIPQHEKWSKRITAGTASVDGLMTAAALATFTADQAELDARIREYIT